MSEFDNLKAQKDSIVRKQEDEIRLSCWRDMVRFIENCRKDSTPDVPAYETLTVMLATLNDVGMEGFGKSDWQKHPFKKVQP